MAAGWVVPVPVDDGVNLNRGRGAVLCGAPSHAVTVGFSISGEARVMGHDFKFSVDPPTDSEGGDLGSAATGYDHLTGRLKIPGEVS